MARAIDGDKLVEDLRLIATCWSVSSFVSKEKHNGAIDMLKEVEREVKELPTLTPPNEGAKDKNVPTNEPLTLEELSLCNDPVWIKRIGDEDLCDDGWAIVEGPICLTWHNRIPVSWEIRVWWPGSEVEDFPKYENYRKTWLAYRRPPEGEEENACRM